jgi:K+-transporting ATPase KdpF subunit
MTWQCTDSPANLGHQSSVFFLPQSRFLRFFYALSGKSNRTFTLSKSDSVHPIELEVRYGCGIRFDDRGAVARPGADGPGPYQTGTAKGRAAMNTLNVLYGAGGLCAALLLVYLVYALFRAEEF